ncbi:MAG: hypothetical protein SVK08_02940 [Halobacteriota archaeon]|nr:hypothetical protein [Halobacteriota archaeon]
MKRYAIVTMVVAQLIFFWFLFKGADDAAKQFEAKYKQRQLIVERLMEE